MPDGLEVLDRNVLDRNVECVVRVVLRKATCGLPIVWEQFGEYFGSEADESQEQEAEFDPIKSPLFSSASVHLSHEGIGHKRYLLKGLGKVSP